MLISVKLITRYVIIIYALGSENAVKSSASEWKPFQSRSKGEIPGRASRKEHIETRVPNWLRRRTFHVLNSMY